MDEIAIIARAAIALTLAAMVITLAKMFLAKIVGRAAARRVSLVLRP